MSTIGCASDPRPAASGSSFDASDPSPRVDATPLDLAPADAPDAPGADAPSIDAARVDDAMDAAPPCRAASDCAGDPAGAACDVASGRCVACVASADTCPAARHCDDATHACAPGCRGDDGCAGAPSDAGAARDADDGGAPAAYCDRAAHACVACLTNAHCPPGTACSAHVCVPACSDALLCGASQRCCAGACVDPATDGAHCGACGRACAYAHAAARCAAGACAMGACEAGFADCDRDPSDGCEVDTRADAANCGACGAACAVANGAPACRAGACAVARCDGPYGDCDGAFANGCEQYLGEVAHCGACGRACPAGLVCNGDTCGPAICCADLHGRAPALPSGVYPLAPRDPPISAYCDMTTEGGGWTLVMMTSSAPAGVFGFDAGAWSDETPLNAAVTDPARDESMKSPAFYQVPVLTEMRFCLGSMTACVDEPMSAATSQTVFLMPESLGTRAAADFTALGLPAGLGCTRVGFNVAPAAAGSARCRYGVLADRGACGASFDSALGFGCRGSHGAAISSGQGDGALPLRQARGWIWVR